MAELWILSDVSIEERISTPKWAETGVAHRNYKLNPVRHVESAVGCES
jgi:hypothetical protein